MANPNEKPQFSGDLITLENVWTKETEGICSIYISYGLRVKGNTISN